VLSSLTDHDGQNYTGAGNRVGDPSYGDYCNGARALSAPGPIQVFLGTGEGGNFADVRFGPLVNVGNYHLTSGSTVAIDSAITNDGHLTLVGNRDIDGDARPQGAASDIGADEFTP